MKIYIPGRVGDCEAYSFVIPIYTDGYYKHVEASYFSQLTRGMPENGVLHSKVVGLNSKVGRLLDVTDINGRVIHSSGSLVKSGNRYHSWQAGASQTIHLDFQPGGTSGNIVSGYYCNYVTVYVETYVEGGKYPNKIAIWENGGMGRIYDSAYAKFYNLEGYYKNSLGIKFFVSNPTFPRCNSSNEAKIAACRVAESAFVSWADHELSLNMARYGSGSGRFARNSVSVASYIEPRPQAAFKFDEVEVSQGVDRMAFGRNSYGYWYNWLIQHAYYDALTNLPTLNDNSISNILELVGFIKSIVVDHKIAMPKRLQDAWLQYRYVYNTTKMDVKEAINFYKRHSDLGSLRRNITSRGTSRTTIQGVDVTCRCKLEISPKNLGYLDEIWRALYQYGLQPNFYVVWDMIPYSFIVDWFIPVGDMASVLDAEANYMNGTYDISNVVFSISYQREMDDGYTYRCYHRWKSAPLRTLNEFYWFDKPKSSNKVKSFRVLDTLSLVIK